MQESELIAELKAGRESAFRILVETYQDKVYNIALVIVQQPEEAEDIAQEVFIEVYQTVRQFREEARLTTWLYRITTSKALAHHRKRKARKRFSILTSLFGLNNEVLHHPPDFHHPGVSLEQKEEMKTLFKAIDQLADTQKVAFILHYIEEQSHREIADVLEVSVSAVESLLHRAKQNLRKQLAPYYKERRNP
ncbi:sigma-70 family RNA polymerase sigma factor [Larkinella terrae]|uniref:RNA polymerase sigma factor n=1 Tax=Larkinella terrae TaxID=2025311 RepID=A0A7K0ERX7_9BACT|nr:sigma-70 family RNA polymerase sigma factor [Larkinella terrae]